VQDVHVEPVVIAQVVDDVPAIAERITALIRPLYPEP
jgi:hypothetical protein